MELAGELRRALDGVCAAGAPEVRENGEWLAGLEDVRYEVSGQNGTALLHLWSGQQSLVRRVLRVAEESAGRVVLEVSRFGYPRPAHLELVAGAAPRETRRVEREQFSLRLRRLLTDHFPTKRWNRWSPPRTCTTPSPAPTRAALCAAARKPMRSLRRRLTRMPPPSTAS